MSGKHITTQQVRLYMSSRKQRQTQEQASAKAGISERSGRRIDGGRISVLESKERKHSVSPSLPPYKLKKVRDTAHAILYKVEHESCSTSG